MTKQEFRKEKLALRNEIPLSQKQIFDKELTKRILSLPEYNNAQRVLLFASVGSEVSTYEILECARLNKNVYFPKCKDSKKMEFYRVNEQNELKNGMYNIPEPTGNTQKYENSNDNDLIIVPALSVGRDFSRLGYGKGYYDRFLKDFKGISVCPVYPAFLFGSVPNEQFDIPLNIIITPNEIIRR